MQTGWAFQRDSNLPQIAQGAKSMSISTLLVTAICQADQTVRRLRVEAFDGVHVVSSD